MKNAMERPAPIVPSAEQKDDGEYKYVSWEDSVAKTLKDKLEKKIKIVIMDAKEKGLSDKATERAVEDAKAEIVTEAFNMKREEGKRPMFLDKGKEKFKKEIGFVSDVEDKDKTTKEVMVNWLMGGNIGIEDYIKEINKMDISTGDKGFALSQGVTFAEHAGMISHEQALEKIRGFVEEGLVGENYYKDYLKSGGKGEEEIVPMVEDFIKEFIKKNNREELFGDKDFMRVARKGLLSLAKKFPDESRFKSMAEENLKDVSALVPKKQ
jgi:hypothetical protein